MFSTLKAEMARQDINIGQLAEKTGIPRQRLASKINGTRKLLMNEAVSIKKALGIDMPLETLFENERG